MMSLENGMRSRQQVAPNMHNGHTNQNRHEMTRVPSGGPSRYIASQYHFTHWSFQNPERAFR